MVNINFMKKIILVFVLIVWLFLPLYNLSAWCNVWVDDVNNVWSALDTCLSDSDLVNWEQARIETWVKDLISSWVANIASVLWILAVWSIVYGSLLLTLSSGDDEKVKKAKDVIKWWIIWFVWLISASTIILLVVNIMYSLEVL